MTETQQLLNIFEHMDDKLSEQYPNWELHDICPVCKTPSVGGCKCILADQVCKHGHNWFMCPVHHKTVIGSSNHTIDSYQCQCDSTAFYRTEA